MNQKDYVAFTAKIHKLRNINKTAMFSLADFASLIADVCERHDPRFNREQFYQACGWGTGPIGRGLKDETRSLTLLSTAQSSADNVE